MFVGNGELRRRHPDQNRDRMFVLGSRNAHIGRLSDRRIELGFRGRHVLVGVETIVEERLYQVQVRLIVRYRCLENTAQLIRDAQLKVILREGALGAQQRIRQLGCARLRRVAVRRHGVADAAPEIDLIRRLERQIENIPRRGDGGQRDGRRRTPGGGTAAGGGRGAGRDAAAADTGQRRARFFASRGRRKARAWGTTRPALRSTSACAAR